MRIYDDFSPVEKWNFNEFRAMLRSFSTPEVNIYKKSLTGGIGAAHKYNLSEFISSHLVVNDCLTDCKLPVSVMRLKDGSFRVIVDFSAFARGICQENGFVASPIRVDAVHSPQFTFYICPDECNSYAVSQGRRAAKRTTVIRPHQYSDSDGSYVSAQLFSLDSGEVCTGRISDKLGEIPLGLEISVPAFYITILSMTVFKHIKDNEPDSIVSMPAGLPITYRPGQYNIVEKTDKFISAINMFSNISILEGLHE